MSAARSFFESDDADRLMDSSYYPSEILEFLQHEQRVLDALDDQFDLLIEVGCMDGRYLDWAIDHHKRYLGIDLILRHILVGQQIIHERKLPPDQYSFLLGDAEEIDELLTPERIQSAQECCLILFPFNIFGAVPDCEKVLTGLYRSQIPFVISSYQTDAFTTACRYEYYQRCGCKDIRVVNDEKGIRFCTTDGFQTIAYYPDYLKKLGYAHNISIEVLDWSKLNVLYMTGDLFKTLKQGAKGSL
jgi:hypothetical protein